MPRREPQRPNHGRQAAGLRSAFLPAGGFQGPKEGYEFKKGDQGVGYYRVHERASRTDFLAALEQAEARDNASRATGWDGSFATSGSFAEQQWQQQQPFAAAYRQPDLYQKGAAQPEWARVGVSEATLAYSRNTDEQLAAYSKFDRKGLSRMQRTQFEPIASQVSLQQAGAEGVGAYRRTMPTEATVGVGKVAAIQAVRPAGGAPNMSGHTDVRTGVGSSMLAQNVNFLTT